MTGDLRPLQPADAAQVAALADELDYPGVTPALVTARLATIAGSGDHAAWVHDRGGRLLGLIHAQHMHRIISPSYAEILHLVVSAQARRTGVGRALVDRVVEWARERGVDRVRVRSNVVRDAAHPFYLSLGFERHKTQHVYLFHL
ncbi:MAG TPA: GNAT family N-acetyltransferase [Kofleriaceae bacterium]|nr:GNAT family N-acetyltransferase [Kofleriaceae bacterium]